MKVILTQDVEKLGHAMDVVTVADGYARNYLFPRSMAMTATKSSLASLDNMKSVEDRRQAKLKTGAEELAAKIGDTLDFSDANVGEGGRLFGAITAARIAEQLQAQYGVEVERRSVLLQDPIHAEGFYTVPLRLHRDVTKQLRVKVGNPAEPTEAPAEAETEEVAA
ncbi:50S ribosomal protein L9 [Abditibacteriota bacterium]|nr:50S ribosomal protein L9 [Abditibacteriota bacterium]